MQQASSDIVLNGHLIITCTKKPAALRNVEKEIKSFILEQYHRLNIINIIEKDALIKRACGKVKMN